MWRFQFTEITQLSSLSAGFYGLSHRNPIHTFELRSLGLFVSAMCPLFPRRHAKPTSFRAFCTQSDSVSLIGLAANKSCIIVALDCLASWPASRMAFKRSWVRFPPAPPMNLKALEGFPSKPFFVGYAKNQEDGGEDVKVELSPLNVAAQWSGGVDPFSPFFSSPLFFTYAFDYGLELIPSNGRGFGRPLKRKRRSAGPGRCGVFSAGCGYPGIYRGSGSAAIHFGRNRPAIFGTPLPGPLLSGRWIPPSNEWSGSSDRQ